jgi:PAS domain S-box-containing protein
MTEKGFFTIFDNSPVPTAILSGKFPNVYYKEANAAYLELIGRSREELLGRPFLISTPHPAMHLDEQGFTDVRESIDQVYRTKITVKTPVQKLTKSISGTGYTEQFYLEATNTPVLDREGEIDFVIRTLQNATDIVKASEKQRLQERELLAKELFLVETQNVARTGSWEMDSYGRFKWSDVHYEIMEVERGTEITVDLGMSMLKRDIDRQVFSEVYARAVESGDSFDVELCVLTPKGNERWIRFMGMGELKDGEFVRAFGIGQDITLQKQTQEELRVSRDRLETIIQTLDGVVFECDAETLEYHFVSEQIFDLLGYEASEVLHQPGFINRILHPEDRDDTINLSAERLQLLNNHTGDYRLIRKDGAVRWIKISVSVIRENGSARWLRGLMMDITPSKVISELEHVEKEVLELNARPGISTESVLKYYLQGIELIFPEMHCSIMKAEYGKLYSWVSISLPQSYLDSIQGIPIADHVGSCGTAAFRNEKVIVTDIRTDRLWENFKEPALTHQLLSCWSQPLRNAAGEVIATLGMYYNTIRLPTEEELKLIDRTVNLLQVILQDRSNQDELQASESRLRSLVDSQTNFVIRIDFDGLISYANSKYQESFGPGEGQDVTGSSAMQSVVPDHKQRVDEASKRCLAQPGQVVEVELEKYDRQGHILYTFWHFVCLTDAAGEPTEIQCIGIDISEQKKAEDEREKKAAELQRSEERYSDLFDLSPQPMWVYDTESLKFLDVNKAAVEQYGYSIEEFLAMPLTAIQSDEIPEYNRVMDERIGGEEFYQGVFTHRTKSGELIRVDMKHNTIPFKGRMARLVLAINITEPLKYLDALERQNLRLAEIGWIQSHVVRAPLSRIMGLAVILKTSQFGPDEQATLLENIHSSATELDLVIRDIVRKAEEVQPVRAQDQEVGPESQKPAL